jgi:hypothetical protein
MIKKNTRAIFREDNKERTEELVGGIPLSIGEIMIINDSEKSVNWKVVDKKVEYANKGEDQFVEVTYTFERD